MAFTVEGEDLPGPGHVPGAVPSGQVCRMAGPIARGIEHDGDG